MIKPEISVIKKLIYDIDKFKVEGVAGTTRHALSAEEMAAREYVCSYMKQLGMSVNTDCMGNVFACYEGTDPALSPIWTGSHIDTVTNAGMFDGVLGIVCALELIRCLKEEGIRPLRSIFVNIYTCEESTVFGCGCIGSRALSGHINKEELESIKDFNGRSLKEYLESCGIYDEDKCHNLFGNSFYKPKASVELHIEQGPWLEKTGNTIGIVEAICAPTNIMVNLKGVQSHAGGTSMEDRKDAFTALSEISMALEETVRTGESEYSTGTIGYVKVTPNAVNVIPGEVEFSIDIRDCDETSKIHIEEKIMNKIDEICKKRGIEYSYEYKSRDIPIRCDEGIKRIIEDECQKNEISYMRLISGAYHDSLFIGEMCPVAMIFVPSRDGISHSPKEWTDFEDIQKASVVLKETILRLAKE